MAGEARVAIRVETELPTDRISSCGPPKLGDLAAACRAIAGTLGTLGRARVVTTQNGVRAPDIVRAALGVAPVHAILQLNAARTSPGWAP